MTEDVLDKLRSHAARMHDEASRLVRALRPSNANEEQVREHLGHVEDAARKCRAEFSAPVSVPFVQVQDDAPPVETTLTTTPPQEFAVAYPASVETATTSVTRKSRRGKGDT